MSIFPTLNACLNASAFVLLFLGWRAIKREDRALHQKYMVATLVMSALFLCSYLTYHALRHGAVTKYEGEGLIRIIYFTILLTHTPLATLMVPFCILAVVFAWRKNFAAHVKITQWLLPVWMYVSVTGVLIYLMLYVF